MSLATPLKRICIRAAKSRSVPATRTTQWQPTRPLSSSLARQRDEFGPESGLTLREANEARRAKHIAETKARAEALEAYGDKISEAVADRHTELSGVTYTAEENEDLSRIDEGTMSALAHRELEQHRELREMVRLAAWEMPLLSQHSKPFEPPRGDQILRWRYTTYLGETHPAARKVVVEFEPGRIPDLAPEQLSKLLKIAGVRYNPSTKIVKMSCESFETQAQNKRYLAETIGNLIAECKDPNADSFADVPLDTRHHRQKPRYRFPDEWVMTPERKAELDAKRRASMLEEGRRIEEDRLISGLEVIDKANEIEEAKVREAVMANARQTLTSGRPARRDLGQRSNARR